MNENKCLHLFQRPFECVISPWPTHLPTWICVCFSCVIAFRFVVSVVRVVRGQMLRFFPECCIYQAQRRFDLVCKCTIVFWNRQCHSMFFVSFDVLLHNVNDHCSFCLEFCHSAHAHAKHDVRTQRNVMSKVFTFKLNLLFCSVRVEFRCRTQVSLLPCRYTIRALTMILRSWHPSADACQHQDHPRISNLGFISKNEMPLSFQWCYYGWHNACNLMLKCAMCVCVCVCVCVCCLFPLFWFELQVDWFVHVVVECFVSTNVPKK